jgi:phenylpyruvate tautomerase PptA (4-oxalocrotonate tautomerase family)
VPMTKIYLRSSSSREHRRAISQAIHESLMEVLGIPADDLYHVFHEFEDDYLISAPVAFGLERRREGVFIQFYFGPRPAEVLQRLYADVVKRLGDLAGLEPRDIYLNVVPSSTENWWADGRVVDPATGFDERIPADKLPPRN